MPTCRESPVVAPKDFGTHLLLNKKLKTEETAELSISVRCNDYIDAKLSWVTRFDIKLFFFLTPFSFPVLFHCVKGVKMKKT